MTGEVQHLLQERHRLTFEGRPRPGPGVRFADLLQSEITHGTRHVGGAIQRGVVYDHHASVQSNVHVDLQRVTAYLDGALEGCQGILGGESVAGCPSVSDADRMDHGELRRRTC